MLALVAAAAAAIVPSGVAAARPRPARATQATPRYFVYWDENEQEDSLRMPGDEHGQLIPPSDPNGQLCIMPSRSGRFVVGYNPTLASQHNPGSTKPKKAPPVGEALYERDGKFTGQTLFVPGPYKLPGQKVGGDIPPDKGKSPPEFNSNGTYTGCVFDTSGNLFASDLGTAQGAFPSPDNGRLIEWFAPSYTKSCVVLGPTTGGVGPHHVDGQGGLQQPSDLALDKNGDIMLPEAGVANGSVPAGRVLRVDHTSLPTRAQDCPNQVYPPGKARTSVFFQGSLSLLPFPLAIARDPTCDCWAIDSTIGDTAVAWFDDNGQQLTTRAVIPGEAIADIGADPNGYNPFGIAFAPDGTLYMVDIHLHCGPGLTDCGPTTKGGRVLRFRFTDGQPGAPETIASGLDFPTSVTVCVPSKQPCPIPKPTKR
jgi:sugar lactone lactonase YvrE